MAEMRVLDQLRMMLRKEDALPTSDIVTTCLIAGDEAEEAADLVTASECKTIAQFVLFDTACEEYRDRMDAASVAHAAFASPGTLQAWRRSASLQECPPRHKRFEKFSRLVLKHSRPAIDYVLQVKLQAKEKA